MSDETAARRKPGGLGRGLSALLGDITRDAADSPGEAGEPGPRGVELVAVTRLAPHPDQPRRQFDDAALDELAGSIAQRGIIQPIVVRPWGEGYQIVAGERRWRAAQRAHLHEVPVIVRDFDDAETLEIALVENIQREDLNAIEEAEAYRRLIDDFGHTQDALARLVHKSRSHVANLLRLLDLPPPVRTMVATGELTMGHARALASSPAAETLAHRAVARGLSVREVEALARQERGGSASRGRSKQPAPAQDADIVALERQLADVLGLTVAISHGAGSGKVTINYATLDQLDMICQRLSGEAI